MIALPTPNKNTNILILIELQRTSYGHVNNSHVETIKYLINKDLLIYLEL